LAFSDACIFKENYSMFDQIGSDESERGPVRLRILKPLMVTLVTALLFGGLFLMTQVVD
jgi:hypothetical protein